MKRLIYSTSRAIKCYTHPGSVNAPIFGRWLGEFLDHNATKINVDWEAWTSIEFYPRSKTNRLPSISYFESLFEQFADESDLVLVDVSDYIVPEYEMMKNHYAFIDPDTYKFTIVSLGMTNQDGEDVGFIDIKPGKGDARDQDWYSDDLI